MGFWNAKANTAEGIGAALLISGVAIVVVAPMLSSSSTPDPPVGPPKPDPIDIPPPPQGGGGSAITIVALTSMPNAGPVHQGALRSDGSWTISTQAGSTVAQGKNGEQAFLDAWNFYTQGGVQGVIIRGGIFGGFTVRPPPCAEGAPNRWCYIVNPSGFVRRAASRSAAIAAALARARAGA